MKTVTISREFFCFAAKQDLANWQGLPEFITEAYTVGVVCDGESTYLCSTQPSSFVHELRNEFNYRVDAYDAYRDWVENDGQEFEYTSCDPNYYSFVNHERAGDTVSEKIKFSDEFEVPDDFDPERDALPDKVRQALWDQAVEYFSGNWHSPACIK